MKNQKNFNKQNDQPAPKNPRNSNYEKLFMMVYNMADMFFIGRLGNTAMVAAISLVSPVFSLIMALATMAGAGGSILIANAFGAGEIQQAKTYSSLCFYFCLITGLVLIPVLLGVKGILLPFLGATVETMSFASTYLSILAAGAPMMLLSTAFGTLIRSEGAIKEALLGNMAGTITNIILDPIFILVLRWDVAGAAIATVIGNIVATACYLWYIRHRAAVLSIRWQNAARQPLAVFSILALGLPNAVTTILSGFASSFSNRLLSQYGTNAIAAMASAGKTNMLATMLQMGVVMGVQPLLSYNYGAKDKARMKEVISKLTILTFGIGLSATLICFLFRHAVIGIFLKDAAAAAMGEELVIYLMIGAPFLGIYHIAVNFLQASKNARTAILASVLRQGVILIPMLYLCHAAFGYIGIALSHTITDIGAALIGLILFLRQYRKFMAS